MRTSEATISEAHLWANLRTRWPGWVREHPSGPYRLDFFCPEARLAVEIDGSSHASPEAARRDMQRDGWHRDRGILTLRFTTGEVMRSRRAVLRRIETMVAARTARARWTTRRRHRKAVLQGSVYVGPDIERVVTAADLPLEVVDERQAAAMRQFWLKPPSA